MEEQQLQTRALVGSWAVQAALKRGISLEWHQVGLVEKKALQSLCRVIPTSAHIVETQGEHKAFNVAFPTNCRCWKCIFHAPLHTSHSCLRTNPLVLFLQHIDLVQGRQVSIACVHALHNDQASVQGPSAAKRHESTIAA